MSLAWLVQLAVFFNPRVARPKVVFLLRDVVFSVLFSVVVTSLWKRKNWSMYVLILHAYLFFFLLVSGIDCDLSLWRSLDFSSNLSEHIRNKRK